MAEQGADGLGARFARAVGTLGAARGRVIVTGVGKSGHVGRKIAATFASTGRPASFVHAAEAAHGDLGMIQDGDCVLALSWSGESAELAAITAYARRFAIPLVAITAKADGALARAATVALVLPAAEEACPNGLAPTTSTTMQLALGDALAVALLEARGFTALDFRVYHPGGKLGALLTSVEEVMHVGARMPVVGAGATMAEAMAEMTAKGLGCALVCEADGRLAGIVTDGDLRRHAGPDLPTRPVGAVMSRAPRVVPAEASAVEALDALRAHRVTQLAVVDGAGRARGLVHLHDLLKLGIA
ncbi:MAG: KpsF/GutQ family sugar-phosphate isomerase [Hyphomicrobiales bacterium]|nr:KpsF/GutQ family sugar-phosphate isomerase [Hyphomicrobiales bacterium]